MTESAKHFVGPLTFETLSDNELVQELFPKTGSSRRATSACPNGRLPSHLPGHGQHHREDRIRPGGRFFCRLRYSRPVRPYPCGRPWTTACPPIRSTWIIARSSGNSGSVSSNRRRASWPAVPVGKGRLARFRASSMRRGRPLLGGRSLSGKKVMVTAGPTREYLDPVRYLQQTARPGKWDMR